MPRVCPDGTRSSAECSHCFPVICLLRYLPGYLKSLLVSGALCSVQSWHASGRTAGFLEVKYRSERSVISLPLAEGTHSSPLVAYQSPCWPPVLAFLTFFLLYPRVSRPVPPPPPNLPVLYKTATFPCLLCPPSLTHIPSSADSPGHTQSASFPLCSGLFRMPLHIFFLSTIKNLPH